MAKAFTTKQTTIIILLTTGILLTALILDSNKTRKNFQYIFNQQISNDTNTQEPAIQETTTHKSKCETLGGICAKQCGQIIEEGRGYLVECSGDDKTGDYCCAN
jgi:alpha-tubulin suppressor-like RCC1 family protein